MTGTLRQEQHDGVAVIRLSQPPLNTLTPALRRDLDAALAQAMSTPGIVAILLTGLPAPDSEPGARPHGFSTGLDLREAATGFATPQVSDICQRIEAAPIPVVVLLHGTTTGAGAELALAAHARVATGEAALGFPDVMMGLCPAAGASQRLPRLLGAQGALDLLLSQHPRPLRSRALRPLTDRLVPENDGTETRPQANTRAETQAETQALALARTLAADLAAGVPLSRTGELRDGLTDFAANAAAIAARRAQVADSPNPAGARIVDCVEAASLLPFAAGLAYEAAAFEDLLASDVSQSLRHATFAERRAAQIPELARATPAPPPLRHVAIVGGGTAAAAIAVACLAAGLPVVQFERSDAALATLSERIATARSGLLRAGQTTPEALAELMRLWQGTTQLGDLARADLLIEAVADTLSTKQQVMAALDRLASEGAVLATTTQQHRIAAIATATSRPEQVLGLRLAAPAHLTRLAEVIPGPATADAAMARTVALLRGPLRRLVVRSATGGGGMGTLILAALREAGAGMLRRGTSPLAIDGALQAYGLAQGLFRQMDLTGLETCLTQGQTAAAQLGLGQQHLGDLDRLIMAGRRGQGAGRGYYLWQEGKAQQDLAVTAILDLGPPSASGPTPGTALTPEAIVLRALAAMANAGARALAAGIALRPSDIDVVMIQGHGFPRWHGGPMQAADLVGLFEIVQALKRFTPENPALYTPEASLLAMVREGQRFSDLNHPA